MAVRKNLNHSETVRARIRTSQIVRRLRKHVLGQLEMTATQVRAAEILLKKTIPDLSAIEHSGEVIQRHAAELSDTELANIATAGSAGATAPTPGATEPPAVH